MVNYRIAGWAEYDDFLLHLRRLGIDYQELRNEWCDTHLATPEEERDLRRQGLEPARLRRASFVHPSTGNEVLIEEYIKTIRHGDSGRSFILSTVQYRSGERPPLYLWKEVVW